MKKNSKKVVKKIEAIKSKTKPSNNKKVNNIAKALDAFLRSEMQSHQKASINAIKSSDKVTQKKRKAEAERLAKSLVTSLGGIAKKLSVAAPVKTKAKTKPRTKAKPRAKRPKKVMPAKNPPAQN
jgi:hypothetical protein